MPASQHQSPKSDIEISQAAKKQPIIELAKERLGWQPTTRLHDGLSMTIAHFRKVVASASTARAGDESGPPRALEDQVPALTR